MVKRAKYCTRQQGVSNVYQQVFVPASKGLITSAPSSLIPNGTFQEVNNVRFDDGYVEKVQPFTEDKTIEEDSPILAINVYQMNNGNQLNMIHTQDGLYNVLEGDEEFHNLLDGEDYDIQETPYISSVTAFNKYFFCSPSSDIYFWEIGEPKAKKLYGTYQPDEWQAEKDYELGDIVAPTGTFYSGYIYKCTQAGRSGTVQPQWIQNMTEQVIDGTVNWVGCGSIEVEGSSAIGINTGCVEQ